MIHEIIGTIFFFELDEELDVFRNENFHIRKKMFNTRNPTANGFEGLEAIQIGLGDDTQWAFTEEVQLAFWMNVCRPEWSEIFRPGRE
jgi:hypothetical protein